MDSNTLRDALGIVDTVVEEVESALGAAVFDVIDEGGAPLPELINAPLTEKLSNLSPLGKRLARNLVERLARSDSVFIDRISPIERQKRAYKRAVPVQHLIDWEALYRDLRLDEVLAKYSLVRRQFSNRLHHEGEMARSNRPHTSRPDTHICSWPNVYVDLRLDETLAKYGITRAQLAGRLVNERAARDKK